MLWYSLPLGPQESMFKFPCQNHMREGLVLFFFSCYKFVVSYVLTFY